MFPILYVGGGIHFVISLVSIFKPLHAVVLMVQNFCLQLGKVDAIMTEQGNPGEIEREEERESKKRRIGLGLGLGKYATYGGGGCFSPVSVASLHSELIVAGVEWGGGEAG